MDASVMVYLNYVLTLTRILLSMSEKLRSNDVNVSNYRKSYALFVFRQQKNLYRKRSYVRSRNLPTLHLEKHVLAVPYIWNSSFC